MKLFLQLSFTLTLVSLFCIKLTKNNQQMCVGSVQFRHYSSHTSIARSSWIFSSWEALIISSICFHIFMCGYWEVGKNLICLNFFRCLPLCAVLIVILDSENSIRREWRPAVLIVLPAQKMRFPTRQVSNYCREKSSRLTFFLCPHCDIEGAWKGPALMCNITREGYSNIGLSQIM